MSENDILAIEFDVLIAKAGLFIPADRREAVLEGYADVKRMAALLRSADLTAADEPANVYSFSTITRSA